MSSSTTRVRTATRAFIAAMLAAMSLPVAVLTAAPAGAAGLPPQSITLSVSKPEITANGTETGTLSATIVDAAGLPFTDTDGVVEVVTSGDMTFSPSSRRLGHTTGGVWTIRYRASKTAGTETLTVTARNAATTGTPPSKTISVKENPGAVETVTVALNPSHIPADGTSKSNVIVTLADAFGNKVAGQNVVLGVSGDTTPSAMTDNTNGTYSGQITASNSAGTEVVTATGGGKTGTANLVEYGAPTNVTLALNPSTVIANGTSTSQAKVIVTDTAGNGVANRTVEITRTGTDDPENEGDSVITPVTNVGDGSYTAVITSSTTDDIETYTATVADTNLTTSANLTETPGPVHEVILGLGADGVGPDTIVADGIQTSTATIRVEDVNNNLIRNENVVLSKGVNDNVVLGEVTKEADGTYKAIITSSTTIGTNTITATVGGKSDSETLTEIAGAPSSVAVTVTPSTLIANGTNTAVAKATMRDANNNLVTGTPITFSVTEGDVTVNGPVTANPDGSYQVSIKSSTTAGLNTITAKAGDTGPSGAAPLTETHGPANSVALTWAKGGEPATAEVVADGADTITAIATVLDLHNNKVVNENVTITAAASDLTVGPVSFDSATQTYRATITSSKTAGTELVTAKANNANKSTTGALLEKPGAVHSVTVAANPTSMPANGTSTSQITTTVKDANDNAITNEIVEVTATGMTGDPLVATHQGNGVYTATVTATTTPGDRTVTATAKNAEKSGTTTINQFGAVETLTLTTNRSIVPADGTSTGTLTATLKDAAGNPITNASVGFGTNGNIALGPTVTNNGNGTYSTPFRASTTPGVETITATSGKTATTQITEHGPATTVTVSLDPSTVTADGVSKSLATATVTDAGNRPVVNENVTFTTNGDAVPAATANKDNGTYTSEITASSTAGAETITATAGKSGKKGTATLTETAGPATIVTLALNPSSVPADGTTISTATVTVTDAKGNVVPNETVTLATSGDAAPANEGATTYDGVAKTYTGTIKASTTSGVETITATAAGTGAFATASLTELPGGAATVTLQLNPSTIQADGQSTSLATASVKDANGNLVPGGAVTITTDGDTVVGEVTNHGNGTHTAPITASTSAGTETITATATGIATPATATLTESAGPVASIVVALDPASIVANGTSTTKATATVKDEFGNLVTNETVSFAKDGVIVVPSATNNEDGTYSADIVSSTVAGPKQIVATAAGSGQTGVATLTETAGPLSTFTLALNPTTVIANGTAKSVATATAADAYGNAIKDEVVTIVSSGDASEAAVVNNNDGTYSSELTASTTAGAETITATATKAVTTATAVLTETAGPVNTVTVSLTPASIVADGASSSLATATVKDANNNVVKDAVVAFSTTGDAVLGAASNKGDGTYTSAITSSTTAGVETIKATVAAVNKSGSAFLTETAGPATSVVVSLSPSSIVADGLAKSVATATVRDVNNNLVPNETVTFVSSGDAKPSATSNKGNGTYTSTITASKTAGTETITATATNANKKATATLTETVRPGGYWLTAADGGIFSYGSAKFHGSIGGTVLNQPVVGMLPTPDKGGYWQVASDGGIFTYGNAQFRGSMGGQPLNAPVVGMAGTTNGQGYWLVASDGGIFAFNAPFLGSMGGQPLNKPINGMMADPDGDGYWFVASDGGIFAYNAPFYGSLGGTPLAAPIVAMAPAPDGKGYWMAGANGAVFRFGSAGWHGDMAGTGVDNVVGIAPTSTGKGYWLTTSDGDVFAFGDAAQLGSPAASGVQLVSPISGIAGF